MNNMKHLSLLFSFILASLSLSAQDAISYQAVARNAEGKILSEQQIGVKVEILQGSAEGAAVYSETHEAETSPTGVVNLSIGNGAEPSGAFSDIDWGASTYFLKLSMDTEGGKDYQAVSTTQIMPVPVALYAKEAGNVRGSESFAMPRYVISSGTSGSDNLFDHLDGRVVSFDKETGKYHFGTVQFTLSYLRNIDEQLTADIEGLDDAQVDLTGSSPSSQFGRIIDINCYFKNKADSCFIVIKDKDGVPLNKYTLKLKYQ